jgi:hypothetical protein
MMRQTTLTSGSVCDVQRLCNLPVSTLAPASGVAGT